MILTEENRNTGRKTCHNATLSTINPIRTGLRLNKCLHGEQLAGLSHAKAQESLLQPDLTEIQKEGLDQMRVPCDRVQSGIS